MTVFACARINPIRWRCARRHAVPELFDPGRRLFLIPVRCKPIFCTAEDAEDTEKKKRSLSGISFFSLRISVFSAVSKDENHKGFKRVPS